MTRFSKLLLPLVLSTTFLAQQAVATNKCYALALSSGQENAAYQAGVLQGLLNKVPADQLRYSAVSGIAGGAVNAAIMGGHAVGDEAAAAA